MKDLSEHQLCSHIQTAATTLRQLQVEIWLTESDALTVACGQCHRTANVKTYPPGENDDEA